MSNGNTNESVNTGSSSIAGPAVDPNAPAGQPEKGQSAAEVPSIPNEEFEKQYRALEHKLGQQGQELGEYRQFFESVSPLLDKLDKDPELVQAILEEKIDNTLVKAVVEGRVDIKDAQIVTEAEKQVKQDLGKKIETTSSQDVEKLIETKVSAIRREFEEKADLQDFEARTTKFIEETGDFNEYAEEIDRWLDEHDVTDIEVAYYAVKGQLSEAAARKQAEEQEAERAKEIAMNASGGGVTSQYADDGTPIIDKLISNVGNPNVI